MTEVSEQPRILLGLIEDRTDSYFETSVIVIPEERECHLHRGESLKSLTPVYAYISYSVQI
jgi:hypothetical protein